MTAVINKEIHDANRALKSRIQHLEQAVEHYRNLYFKDHNEFICEYCKGMNKVIEILYVEMYGDSPPCICGHEKKWHYQNSTYSACAIEVGCHCKEYRVSSGFK